VIAFKSGLLLIVTSIGAAGAGDAA
jgi:hypothetical protein